MRDLPSSRDIASAAFMLCRSGWCLLLVVVGDGVTGVVLQLMGSCSRGLKMWGKRERDFDRQPTFAGSSPHGRQGESLKRVPQWAQDVSSKNGEGAPRGCSSSPASFA